MDEPIGKIKSPKRVSVEEADNGFMVSMMSSEPGGEKKMVCKNMEEAKAAMEKMMTGKSEEPKKETEEDVKKGAVDFFKKNKSEED